MHPAMSEDGLSVVTPDAVNREPCGGRFGVSELDLGSPSALPNAAALMVELRPGLTLSDATTFLREASVQRYQALVCRPMGLEQGSVVGLAGFRALATSRGRILVLEDLVVTRELRGQGLGSLLLSHLREYAKEASCQRIELDTGNANHAAQRFYASEGFEALAVHFATTTSMVLPDNTSSV